MDLTNVSSVESYEWDTDDELEMEYFQEIENDQADISSSSSSQNPAALDHFVAMGFNEKLVIRALKENGEEDTEAILNTLLSYPEDITVDTLSRLTGMGYQYVDVVKAIEQCGSNAPLDELTDFIFASQTVKTDTNAPTLTPQKRKPSFGSIEQPRKLVQSVRIRDSINLPMPNNMIGFGIPGYSTRVTKREIPKLASGPPYFYYENVACTPKGVWDQISRFLYDIEPEFVDSLHFSAAARKRGYIHNLPIENRQPLFPIPPKTIHEALPSTKKWWPTWDKREKLNCLLTCIGSAPLTERIRKRVESGTPSPSDIDFVMKQCKKWNLVWVGKYKVAVLEPSDMEMLLGFPQDHTRGVSRTDRYKALGNSFQACGNCGDFGTGTLIHSLVIRGRMRSSRRIDNALLAVYAKCGELSLAEKLFEEINERDIVSWNVLISGYCQRGENGKAHMLFNLMRDEGIEPCLITWNILIAGYSQSGDCDVAMEFMRKMGDSGMSPDVFTWTSLVSDLAQKNRIDETLQFFREMLFVNVQPNGVTMASAISTCASTKSLEKGKELHSILLPTKANFQLFR